LCQGEIETLEHLATNCIIEIKNNTRMCVIQLLSEKGKEVSWMKKILKIRKEKKSNANSKK